MFRHRPTEPPGRPGRSRHRAARPASAESGLAAGRREPGLRLGPTSAGRARLGGPGQPVRHLGHGAAPGDGRLEFAGRRPKRPATVTCASLLSGGHGHRRRGCAGGTCASVAQRDGSGGRTGASRGQAGTRTTDNFCGEGAGVGSDDRVGSRGQHGTARSGLGPPRRARRRRGDDAVRRRRPTRCRTERGTTTRGVARTPRTGTSGCHLARARAVEHCVAARGDAAAGATRPRWPPRRRPSPIRARRTTTTS